jgi:hypothetical protein
MNYPSKAPTTGGISLGQHFSVLTPQTFGLNNFLLRGGLHLCIVGCLLTSLASTTHCYNHKCLPPLQVFPEKQKTPLVRNAGPETMEELKSRVLPFSFILPYPIFSGQIYGHYAHTPFLITITQLVPPS